jgi:hypothetical protein
MYIGQHGNSILETIDQTIIRTVTRRDGDALHAVKILTKRVPIRLTTSLLPRPEHHIRFPGKTVSRDENLARNPFPFLELDIIIRDDMGKQALDFVDHKESSGADSK